MVGSLSFFSCYRKYLLFWVFWMKELVANSHWRSWVIVVPRKGKESSIELGGLAG